MMPGFVKVDSFIFYEDIWPRIKDDVEVIANTRYDTKKGGHTVIIKWGFKGHIKEKIVVAIVRVDATGEKHWVAPALVKRNKE